MIVKLLTEHHLEFLSLKGGRKGSFESTFVEMSNCWKSHALAQFPFPFPTFFASVFFSGWTGLLSSLSKNPTTIFYASSVWKTCLMSPLAHILLLHGRVCVYRDPLSCSIYLHIYIFDSFTRNNTVYQFYILCCRVFLCSFDIMF